MANTTKKEIKVLIKQLVEGRESAYMSVIDIYYNKLIVYAYGLTNDLALGEDLVQNVFMKLWENRKKIKIKESLKSFLYKSVYNEFVNNYRKKQSIRVLDRVYWDTFNTIVDEDNVNLLEDKIAVVKQGIEQLPNKCRQIFILSKQDGLTNSEISEYLNISIKSVEAHITNAYKAIRNNVIPKVNNVNSI